MLQTFHFPQNFFNETFWSRVPNPQPRQLFTRCPFTWRFMLTPESSPTLLSLKDFTHTLQQQEDRKNWKKRKEKIPPENSAMPWACEDERFVMYYSFFLLLPPFVPLGGSRLTDEISGLWGVAPVVFSLKKKKTTPHLWCTGRKAAWLYPSLRPLSAGRQRQNGREFWSIFHFSTGKDARGDADGDILSFST